MEYRSRQLIKLGQTIGLVAAVLVGSERAASGDFLLLFLKRLTINRSKKILLTGTMMTTLNRDSDLADSQFYIVDCGH